MDWAKLLLALTQLVSQVVTWFRENQLITSGQATEVAQELQRQATEVTTASEIQAEADKAHQTQDDTAFDPDYWSP
jgi:hypothetical protein